MIWLHCGNNREAGLTRSLVTHLLDANPDATILVTSDEATRGELSDLRHVISIEAPPVDTPARTKGFLERHSPTHLLWIGGGLRPVLLQAVENYNIPATLLNARSTEMFPRRALWIPGTVRASVSAFSRIMATDGATATRLLRGGVPRSVIEATGPVLEEPVPLEHDPEELATLTLSLGTRPVWLSAEPDLDEVPNLITAHLAALRKNHRLLMVIRPRSHEDEPQIVKQLRKAGLTIGVRSHMDDPDPEQQAYIADLPNEVGLWYRAAPVTFIGGSFSVADTVSPLEPILMGSAVVHGPNTAPNRRRFERLKEAGAAREVRDAAELGTAIAAVTAPEDSARMAFAGWDEMTRNAHLINDVVKRSLPYTETV